MSELKVPLMDTAPVVLTSPQVRDFSKRVLNGVINRLGGGNDWQIFEFERNLTEGDVTGHISLYAERTDEGVSSGGSAYVLKLTNILPMGEDWKEEAVRSLMAASYGNSFWEEDEEEEYGGLLMEDGLPLADNFEQGEFIGYVSIERSFEFRVPRRRRLCLASKSLGFVMLDEDHEPLDFDMAYTQIPMPVHVPPEDIQHLVKFGEMVLDASRHEAELSQVYISDLHLITGALKAAKLVRPDCNPLRANR